MAATAILPGADLADRAAIRAAMETLWTGELEGSNVVYEVQSIRLIAPDVAIVVSKGAVLLAGQTEPDPADRALETWVLARSDESWRVHALHNCPERR